MTKSKKVVALFTAALMIAAAVTSLAWACTGQAEIIMAPVIVQPRSQATVTASHWPQVLGAGEASIRLGDTDGPELARVPIIAGQEAASFRVTIPDLPPGVYYLLAVGPNQIARTAFQVAGKSLGGRGSHLSGDAWSGFSRATTRQALGENSTSAQARPAGYLLGLGLLAFSATALVLVGTAALASARKRSKIRN